MPTSAEPQVSSGLHLALYSDENRCLTLEICTQKYANAHRAYFRALLIYRSFCW